MNDDKIIKTRAYGLTNSTTVFQAEIQAIRMAAPLIKEMVEHGAKVNIMCDSQAAIKALDETTTKSKLVLLAKQALNSLGDTVDITINWIKPHVNHKGNEMADELVPT